MPRLETATLERLREIVGPANVLIREEDLEPYTHDELPGLSAVPEAVVKPGSAQEIAAVLRDVDVLATPTTPKPATPFALAHDSELGFPRSNMPPFNLTGSPTLALPCGFSSAGLPLSLQLAGRPFEETTVLRIGHAYEQATAWHTRRPPV